MKPALLFILVFKVGCTPLVSDDFLFEERAGLVAFEAEHFVKQEHTSHRAWRLTTAGNVPDFQPDPDGPHVAGASGGAYLEILPDGRRTDADKLIVGENFTNEPGTMAVLSYRVRFTTAGRYHVWARVYSTSGEDNGLHVGIDGQWPESGRRWQTVKKNAWQWDSRQRTDAVHVGVPGQLYLDIPTPGEHLIQIAMREDGFELDKILLTNDPKYIPEEIGPPALTRRGGPTSRKPAKEAP